MTERWSTRRVAAGTPAGERIGGPTTVAVADTTYKGLAPMLATPLPHGHGVIFVVCASNCVTMSFDVLDLRSGRTKRLVDNASVGWYLPNGQLVYVQPSGVAMVVPFDLSTLSIRGAPVPVLQGVKWSAICRSWPGPRRARWSTRWISRRHADARRGGPDGAVTTFDSAWSGEFNSFALSPNGRRRPSA